MKKSLLTVFAILFTACLFTGCLEEPGNVALTANKTTVAIDESVTLTLTGVENSTCVMWSQSGGPTYVPVTPIGDNALSVTVKFATAGTVKMLATVKNCKKGGCEGTCADAHPEISITVQ